MQKVDKEIIKQNVKLALQEDLGGNIDITSNLLPQDKIIDAFVKTKEQNAVLCGVDWFTEVFAALSKDVVITWDYVDGDDINEGNVLLTMKGPARAILTGERTALNFLQMLSGTATLTNLFVRELQGTDTKLLDTRKTIPGLRAAQKYAVRCGGGFNHRMGLFDAFLIKENHIRAIGSITEVIKKARKTNPDKVIEIEVENITQLKEAIDAGADIVLLDNFSVEQVADAVLINKHQVKLEASGNVDMLNVRSIAETGVDYISVGSITKHVRAVDLTLLIPNI
jgi:nicotinate-nucleotide pyrophosphorylase (carboxylating)